MPRTPFRTQKLETLARETRFVDVGYRLESNPHSGPAIAAMRRLCEETWFDNMVEGINGWAECGCLRAITLCLENNTKFTPQAKGSIVYGLQKYAAVGEDFLINWFTAAMTAPDVDLKIFVDVYRAALDGETLATRIAALIPWETADVRDFVCEVAFSFMRRQTTYRAVRQFAERIYSLQDAGVQISMPTLVTMTTLPDPAFTNREVRRMIAAMDGSPFCSEWIGPLCRRGMYDVIITNFINRHSHGVLPRDIHCLMHHFLADRNFIAAVIRQNDGTVFQFLNAVVKSQRLKHLHLDFVEVACHHWERAVMPSGPLYQGYPWYDSLVRTMDVAGRKVLEFFGASSPQELYESRIAEFASLLCWEQTSDLQFRPNAVQATEIDLSQTEEELERELGCIRVTPRMRIRRLNTPEARKRFIAQGRWAYFAHSGVLTVDRMRHIAMLGRICGFIGPIMRSLLKYLEY